MDMPTVAFPQNAPNMRKLAQRPAHTDAVAEPPKAKPSGPFHAGLSPEGLGAINAARLTGQNGTDQTLQPILYQTASAAYRSSKSVI